jgi:hypothetical protein
MRLHLVAVPLHLEYAGHHSCALLAVPPDSRPATLGHPQEVVLGGRVGELQVGKLQGQVEVLLLEVYCCCCCQG